VTSATNPISSTKLVGRHSNKLATAHPKKTINGQWWAGWMQCATEGLERSQWEREKTTRGGGAQQSPGDTTTMTKINNKILNNQPMMVVDDGQGGIWWAIEGWASEARGEGEDSGGGEGAGQSQSLNKTYNNQIVKGRLGWRLRKSP
jgi:hypothetical protein